MVQARAIDTGPWIWNSIEKIGKKFLEIKKMVKPWNHPPGKIYYPSKPKDQVEKALKERAEWEEKWDAIFGEKKLNNMEEDDEE